MLSPEADRESPLTHRPAATEPAGPTPRMSNPPGGQLPLDEYDALWELMHATIGTRDQLTTSIIARLKGDQHRDPIHGVPKAAASSSRTWNTTNGT